MLLLLLCVCGIDAAPRPPPSPPSTGAVATGVWRNIFVEAGYPAADVDARLAAIVSQLFFGNPANETLIYSAQDASADAAYLWSVDSNDHPLGDPRAGYACWHAQISGSCLDANPASDGETFAAAALLFAAARWGDAGAINYTAEANIILDAALGKEDAPCGVKGCDSVVNMWGGATPGDKDPPLVRFVPYASAASYTDPSYVTPFFYELYANNSRGDFWRGAAAAGRSFFHAAADSRTALTPDYATFGGQPTGSGKTFSFDAWRTARNVAIDYAWFAADPWGVEFCNRLLGFFRGLPTWPSYGNQFSLDGKQTGGDHSPGLVAMNAVCALASTEAVAYDFVDALWNTSTPSGRFRYYDGVLYLEAWLHLSGRYRYF